MVLRAESGWDRVVNLDKLTYAGRPENIADLRDDPRHTLVEGDILDRPLVEQLFRDYRPQAIVHLAAETHVDRSIVGPERFVTTNVEGTLALLEAACRFWLSLEGPEAAKFRFLHVSTDEVYGSLAPGTPPSTEDSRYAPRSPYAASKAGADHLVHAFAYTYGLPVLLSNCSNNYGPFQLPEKLIPLLIRFALAERELPIYGDGLQIRDWLHVEDHCRALLLLLEGGRPGESYNVGGGNERRNLQIATEICALLDQKQPRAQGSYAELIRFVADRPGHDRRYAINSGKLHRELGWQPSVPTVEAGLALTVEWYLANSAWVEQVTGGEYGGWIAQNYEQRGDRRGQ